MKLSALGLLIFALAACRKPPIDDPAEAAYHRAVELFAKASADTHDLTYRNPRFDEVLAALAEVPAGDDLRTKADALVKQILDARAEAARADGESESEISRALAAPEFSPQARDAPFPAPAPPGPRSPVAGSPTATDNSGYAGGGYGGGGNFSKTASHKPGSNELPDWYRQAGYLGLGKHPGATPAAPDALGPPPPVDATASAPAAAALPPNVAPSTATPVVTQGPPPVFGLPGPAGRAILGGR